jgi:hypothetical protein
MKTFYLKQKESDKDSLSQIKTSDYQLACEYFASVKNLSIFDLLKIYVVVSKS